MLKLGMTGALWLGFTLLPVLFFFFLRTRFRRQPVSSIYIWSRFIKETRGNNRLRHRSVGLLVVQIIAVLIAVLALAQPFWFAQHLAQPGMVFLIDVSASMATVDEAVGVNRLAQAGKVLAAELKKLPRGTKIKVFLCAQDAIPLDDNAVNPRTIRGQLEQVTIGGAEFNETAVALQLQSWLSSQKQPWQGCLISDGGLDLGGRRLSQVFDGAFSYLTVGTSRANLGITGLRLVAGDQFQFIISNGWLTVQSVEVVLEASRKAVAHVKLNVPPGLTRHVLKVNGPWGPGVYTIRFNNHRDALAIDDRYDLAVNPPRKVRVLLAGPANPFLKAALRHPGIELTEWRQLPAKGFTGAAWDLVVADRITIPPGLKANLLAFNRLPPESPAKLKPVASGVLRTAATAHPLLRFVDWRQIRITGGSAIQNAVGSQVLAYLNRQPVIVVWEDRHYRKVVAGIDLFRSDLGLAADFPIFIQNLVHWCVPQQANPLAYNLSVGVPVRFAADPAWQISDTNGLRVERQGPFVTVTALKPGVYHWQEGETQGVITANPHFSEADITPKPLLLTAKPVKAAAELTTDQVDLLRGSLLCLLFCLSLEWFLWRGGLAGRSEAQ